MTFRDLESGAGISPTRGGCSVYSPCRPYSTHSPSVPPSPSAPSSPSSRPVPPLTKCLPACCCTPCPPLPLCLRTANENLLVLNIIQFLCGVASIVLSAVSISNQVFLYRLGSGLWAGLIMLVTGVHGMVTARKKRLCSLISLLVLCILAAITAVVVACISIVRLAYSSHNDEPNQLPVVVLHALLLVVGCLETSIAIATAVLSSRQICLFVVTTDDSGQTFIIAGANPSALSPPFRSSSSGVHGDFATSGVSEMFLRSVARRGHIPVITGSGSQARASVLYVVPSRDANEPVLVFPPFPPTYSRDEPRPLLPSYGTDSSFLRPALVLAEDPPPYSTLERHHSDREPSTAETSTTNSRTRPQSTSGILGNTASSASFTRRPISLFFRNDVTSPSSSSSPSGSIPVSSNIVMTSSRVQLRSGRSRPQSRLSREPSTSSTTTPTSRTQMARLASGPTPPTFQEAMLASSGSGWNGEAPLNDSVMSGEEQLCRQNSNDNLMSPSGRTPSLPPETSPSENTVAQPSRVRQDEQVDSPSGEEGLSLTLNSR